MNNKEESVVNVIRPQMNVGLLKLPRVVLLSERIDIAFKNHFHFNCVFELATMLYRLIPGERRAEDKLCMNEYLKCF